MGEIKYPQSFKTARLLFTAMLSAVVQAQFNFIFTTDNDTISITGYTGPGSDVVIPRTKSGRIIRSSSTASVHLKRRFT